MTDAPSSAAPEVTAADPSSSGAEAPVASDEALPQPPAEVEASEAAQGTEDEKKPLTKEERQQANWAAYQRKSQALKAKQAAVAAREAQLQQADAQLRAAGGQFQGRLKHAAAFDELLGLAKNDPTEALRRLGLDARSVGDAILRDGDGSAEMRKLQARLDQYEQREQQRQREAEEQQRAAKQREELASAQARHEAAFAQLVAGGAARYPTLARLPKADLLEEANDYCDRQLARGRNDLTLEAVAAELEARLSRFSPRSSEPAAQPTAPSKSAKAEAPKAPPRSVTSRTRAEVSGGGRKLMTSEDYRAEALKEASRH